MVQLQKGTLVWTPPKTDLCIPTLTLMLLLPYVQHLQLRASLAASFIIFFFGKKVLFVYTIFNNVAKSPTQLC